MIELVTIPAEELRNLKERVRRQAFTITNLQDTLARKNIDLDALHFVWCDGACPNGIHRSSDVQLTEEMILRAERNTKRLKRWYYGVKWKLVHYPTMSEWHDRYAKRSASKTDLIPGEQVDKLS